MEEWVVLRRYWNGKVDILATVKAVSKPEAVRLKDGILLKDGEEGRYWTAEGKSGYTIMIGPIGRLRVAD